MPDSSEHPEEAPADTLGWGGPSVGLVPAKAPVTEKRMSPDVTGPLQALWPQDAASVGLWVRTFSAYPNFGHKSPVENPPLRAAVIKLSRNADLGRTWVAGEGMGKGLVYSRVLGPKHESTVFPWACLLAAEEPGRHRDMPGSTEMRQALCVYLVGEGVCVGQTNRQTGVGNDLERHMSVLLMPKAACIK